MNVKNWNKLLQNKIKNKEVQVWSKIFMKLVTLTIHAKCGAIIKQIEEMYVVKLQKTAILTKFLHILQLIGQKLFERSALVQSRSR